ncbi:MAG: PilZ domain-containing protein [Bdellovibrionales bacterium]
MFWRKRKNQPDDTSISMVLKYASQLGIERRQSIRVRYPTQKLSILPRIFYSGVPLSVADLSRGGCCLLDREGRLGPGAGQEIDLRLVWPHGETPVRSRVVSRVENRRHIQFLDLPKEMAELIQQAILPGVDAQSLRPSMTESHRLDVKAEEIWTSLTGDSLVFFRDVLHVADLSRSGDLVTFQQESWPVDHRGKPLSTVETEKVLIYLANIQRPSLKVTELQSQLLLSLAEECK